MANKKSLANLKKFTSANQPKNKGRKPGVPNRATVYKRFLELKTKVADPNAEAESGKEIEVTLYEAAALGQLIAARMGNTPAWREIQDTLFGKQSIKVNFSPEELQNLTDEELDSLINQFER